MKTLSITPHTPEWHAHRARSFNASEAAAALGQHKYLSRDALVARIAGYGAEEDHSPAKQALFARGHAAEAAARPVIEADIGDDLFPVIGCWDEDERFSASFDGLTLMGETAFECKLWNDSLAKAVDAGELEPHYYWQLEHQLLVSGAELVIFVCAREDAGEIAQMTYRPVPGRREQLIAAWLQVAEDAKSYVPPVAKAEPVASPVESLPTIVFTIERGTMALSSNLPEFRAAAGALIERTKAPLVTDQDFADREQLCKAFGEAEKLLRMKAAEAVGQITDVATFARELEDIAEQFRVARLASEKLVDAEKKNRRTAIQQAGERALAEHLASLQARFGGRIKMPTVRGDFAGAIKGKRTLDSVQNAVDTELAQRKIEANQVADGIDANLRALDELAPAHGFLFNDLQNIVTMPAEAFRATVQGRVATHKAQEEAKLQAERERIAKDEREKAEREAREKLAAEQKAQGQQVVEQPAQTAASVVRDLGRQEDEATVARQGGDMPRPASTKATTRAMPGPAEIVKAVASAFGVDTATASVWLQSITKADLQEVA